MNNKPVRRMEGVWWCWEFGHYRSSWAEGHREEWKSFKHNISVQVLCVFCSLSQRDLCSCFFRQLSPPPQDIPIPAPKAFRDEPAPLNTWELNPGR